MKDIILHFRMLQLLAHNAHNLVGRVPFFADHEFLGFLYSEYEGMYDAAVERYIGLYGCETVELNQINLKAAQALQQFPEDSSENTKYFEIILEQEKKLCEKISLMYAKASIGTQQLLGDFCDKSEGRQYKLKQRIKGSKGYASKEQSAV